MYQMDGYSTTEENEVIRNLEQELMYEKMFSVKETEITIKIFEERMRCSTSNKEYKFYSGLVRGLKNNPLYNRAIKGSRRMKLD